MDKDTIIQARKEYGRLIKESKQQAKRQECLWCGKKITDFCNSHSVPQFVLKNIDAEGKLDYYNSLIGIPLLNGEKGIKEAGTFKLLCKSCDGKIFQDYESPDNLSKEPTEIMLEEIALKDILFILNKRFLEIELFNNMKKQYRMPYPYDAKQNVNYLDERDFWWDFIRVKNMIQNKSSSKFKLIFWKKLPYIIPVAFQGLISLYGDLKGDIVTDIYSHDRDKIIEHMHICLFPLESCSVVFAFYHENDNEYDTIAKQLQKLELEDLLQAISYIVFANSEDMLIAKKFPHRTYFKNEVLKVLLQTNEIWADNECEAEYKKNNLRNQLKMHYQEFPKILSERYAVRKENTSH